jgi:hypothetical protein
MLGGVGCGGDVNVVEWEWVREGGSRGERKLEVGSVTDPFGWGAGPFSVAGCGE